MTTKRNEKEPKITCTVGEKKWYRWIHCDIFTHWHQKNVKTKKIDAKKMDGWEKQMKKKNDEKNVYRSLDVRKQKKTGWIMMYDVFVAYSVCFVHSLKFEVKNIFYFSFEYITKHITIRYLHSDICNIILFHRISDFISKIKKQK